jgi:hypothetical protein
MCTLDLSLAFVVVIVNFHVVLSLRKNPNPSEELHMLQQKVVTHFKTLEYVIVYTQCGNWKTGLMLEKNNGSMYEQFEHCLFKVASSCIYTLHTTIMKQLEGMADGRVWNSVQYSRYNPLNGVHVIKITAFQWCFEFWKQKEVTRC